MVLEQLDIHMKKLYLDTDLTSFTKTKSKWIINLNVEYKTMKLLKENIGENLGDLGFVDEFLNKTPKAVCERKKTSW